jgi:large subunit ribosomal protein L25
VSGLEINNSLHLSDVTLPAGTKAVSRPDATLVTIVPPSGYAEELKAAAAAAAGPAEGAAAAPAAGAAAAPAAGAAAAPAAGAAKAPAGGGKK